MFILAHQFRGVSSENNRPDTYFADFAQASRVQSAKHLVSKCHHTTERRLSHSWRHIGLKEASALPQHTVPHPRERISSPASQKNRRHRGASKLPHMSANACQHGACAAARYPPAPPTLLAAVLAFVASLRPSALQPTSETKRMRPDHECCR
jgi:hypothetical protein